VALHRTSWIAALAICVLAGCGDPQATPQAVRSTPSVVTSPTLPGSPLPTTSPGSKLPAVDREIVVTVAKRKVNPPAGRIPVARGSTVRITVTSDIKDELHVHGYELKLALPAGSPASTDFRADKDGLFEVETHDSNLVLFQLLVR
jgi:hypothetical protein